MSGLLDKRLIFVTGKGGVGKSSVAIALGIVGARRRLRTIVAELATQGRLRQAYEARSNQDEDRSDDPASDGRSRELQLAPGLFTISIDPQQAMEEYLRLRTGPLGHALGSSRIFHAFAMATPGMRELLSIGKVWELAQLERKARGVAPYDLVVVDAPATGHGVGLLRTPKTFADIARVGPIAHQGRVIASTIADREFTGVVAVTTAEEMAVNETLSLRAALDRERLHLDAVVLNALYPPRFEDRDAEELAGALRRTSSAPVRGALRAAMSEHVRVRAQREQRTRLSNALGTPLVELPFLFADRIGRTELELLADVLEEGLP